jgi:hypothetical protein
MDALKKQAGLHGIIIPTHPPRAEDGRDGTTPRTRGAAANDDWPDMLWAYYRDDEQRFLKVEGRWKGMNEAAVHFDKSTNLLSVALNDFGETEGRKKTKDHEKDGKILDAITNKPGLSTRQLRELLHMSPNGLNEALKRLEAQDEVYKEGDRHTGFAWHPGSNVPAWPAMGLGGNDLPEINNSASEDQ